MSQTLNKEEFYTIAKIMTKDAFAFLESKQGQDWKQAHYPAYHYRYVHIEPRRDIGKSYAAAKLAADYAPALFVFHSQDWKQEAVKRHYRHDYCPTNPDYAFTAEEILQRDFVPLLGQPMVMQDRNRIRQSPLPPSFKLGIIEDGGALRSKYYNNHQKLDKIRDLMFTCCDIVVEFG